MCRRIHHQAAVDCLDRNALIGEFLFGESRTQSLDGAAADHTRYTEALGYRMSDQIGEVLLRDLNNAEMIFEFSIPFTSLTD